MRKNERGLGAGVAFCAKHDRNCPDEACTCSPLKKLEGEVMQELREDVKALQETLDAEKFVARLSIPMEDEWRTELVDLMRKRDKAMLGATYHSCPTCQCCWLSKVGDADSKRCTCCAWTDQGQKLISEIQGILDEALHEGTNHPPATHVKRLADRYRDEKHWHDGLDKMLKDAGILWIRTDGGMCITRWHDGSVVRRVQMLEDLQQIFLKARARLNAAQAHMALLKSKRKWNRQGMPKAEEELDTAQKDYGKAMLDLQRGDFSTQRCAWPGCVFDHGHEGDCRGRDGRAGGAK